jgi:hypothetical protein
LTCSVIVDDRDIYYSPATSLITPILTRAEARLDISYNDFLTRVDFASLGFVGSHLRVNGNAMLTRVDFASLSYVGGYLTIFQNSALTFASLPRLSQVQDVIYFCSNAPTFVIPNPDSGTAAPGLTSVQHKGTSSCFFQNGSETCDNLVTCP